MGHSSVPFVNAMMAFLGTSANATNKVQLIPTIPCSHAWAILMIIRLYVVGKEAACVDSVYVRWV